MYNSESMTAVHKNRTLLSVTFVLAYKAFQFQTLIYLSGFLSL